MKVCYFVRHGESEANVTRTDPGPESPLTETGQRQAIELSKRCANIDIDVIIASPYLRAHETARVINTTARKPIEVNDLFSERRHESAAPGTKMKESHEMRDSNHFTDPLWREGGGESFQEITRRIDSALKHLIERPEANILVVTHSWFLRALIAVQLFGDELTPQNYQRIWSYLAIKNTGLTVIEYNPSNLYRGWRLITWNDHAHLGEVDN
jgi:broad specificity phosphatase PhoE